MAIARNGAALELAATCGGNSHEDDASVTALPQCETRPTSIALQTRSPSRSWLSGHDRCVCIEFICKQIHSVACRPVPCYFSSSSRCAHRTDAWITLVRTYRLALHIGKLWAFRTVGSLGRRRMAAIRCLLPLVCSASTHPCVSANVSQSGGQHVHAYRSAAIAGWPGFY
jgi:hypothetical protein